MNNFIFQNATKVYFGKGCVKEYLACLTKDADTILLAYGGGSIKRNGVYDEITDILKKEGKTIVEFSGIMSNPTYAKVQEGAKLARDNHADMILAVGGGSTMDCCKAVSLQAGYDGDIWEDFWAHQGVIDFAPLPLGVIVTVAGTGSECNGGAVITNEEKKIKMGRDYPKLNPTFALMDPTYTYSVPMGQMVSGSFDILSHIMETYFSEPDEDNVSDDIMEALMRSVIRNLREAMKNSEDYTARSNLMWDSTMAENRVIKMGKKCDFECHNMEHQLGAYSNCNHGQGLAVIHPVYYRHIYKEGLSKFVRFAKNVWEISDEGRDEDALAVAGISALAEFIKEIGLPTKLKEIGVKKEQLKEIADSCGISQGSYKVMTHEEILQIFEECYE
ncbi:iron-containing alcohol dehydrogenase [Clostridium sp. M62/1]|uniref:iron-containing alcohol dehydrogenase n=1 Tax=Clostridium sp. M62/1 TaxID=411486 RepID=UPI00019733CA|nr:iron-containing alcohol dehydrogenase [Clostridium sp. M62/1]EFE12863.1 alcohol dehydrogenase, iron-dependent [Clostridium sp. M62/1]UEB79220.1 iron-containing alcohol dehydrogenase [Clostridium sp. M62/1]